MTKKQRSYRIDDDLLRRLQEAIRKAGPYAPTETQVVERGIELAIKELERKGKK